MNPSLTKKENKNRRRAKIFVGFLVSTSILGGISLVPIYDGKNIVFAASQMGSELPTLQTGEKIDSATHDYNSADISNGDSWTTAGTASPTSPNQLFSTTLVNNSLSSAGFALFKGTLDMTKPVNFSGNFQIQGTSLEVGDSLGFILTPLDVSSIQNGQTGSRLGLGGLVNSTFLGRDLYYNTGGSGDIFDENPTNAWFSGASNAVVIRSTDSTGNLEYSDGKTGSYPVASAPDKGVDGNINETMGFEWIPTATDPSGVTGILKYTLIPADGSPSVSLEKTMTVASSLSLGVIGATGGNTGVLTYSNNGSTFTASKGTAEVTVNYLDKNTGDKLAEPSTIVANVGDTVNILNSSSQITTTSNYDENYGAPKISGYDYVSATPLEVANNSSNNVINIYYQTQKYTTVNKDDHGNTLSSTDGYKLISTTQNSSSEIVDNVSVTNNITTNIWHKPVNTIVNQDDTGPLLTDISGLKLMSSTTSTPDATTGDTTTTVIWHKPVTINTSKIVNLDENGNELTDTEGYVHSEQIRTPMVTSSVALNGDTTNLTTNYLIWHKVVTKTVNVIRNIDENGKALLNTKGYDKVSQSEKSAHSTAENGDITVTKTLTIQWNKQNLPQKITQSIDKKVEIPSSEAQPAQQTPASSSTQTVGAGPQKSVKKTSQSTKSSKANSTQKRTTPKSSEPSSAVKVEKQTKVQKVKNSAHLNSKPEMTEHQKLMKVLKVESAGAGGAIGGMVISGVLWTLIQKFLPAGLFAFIIGGKRRKKKDEEDK